jgi:hypothetical protein
MIAVSASHGSAARRIAELATTALRGIGWAQVRGAMLFGLVVSMVTTLIFLTAILQVAQTMPLPSMFLYVVIPDQIKALCLLAAIVVADRAVDEGAPRRKAYVIAALTGCVTGILLSEPFNWAWRTYLLPDLWPAQRTWLHGTPSLFYWPIFSLTHWLLIGGSSVFLYADRRAARKTAQLLHNAELDRVRRSKIALESRLQAMQARVEPQFLFNTLAQVERLYDTDPAIAGRMLDDLITYLRAAMPLMRDTSSTVGQEIDLARAYLDIVRIRLGERLAFEIKAPPEIRDVRMPPMMLLPLIDHAIVAGLEPSTATGTISIRTEVIDGRLRLAIADSGAAFVPEVGGDGIDSIRERLAALFGENARLDLRRAEAQATEAVLEIPLETATAGAPGTSTPKTASIPR